MLLLLFLHFFAFLNRAVTPLTPHNEDTVFAAYMRKEVSVDKPHEQVRSMITFYINVCFVPFLQTVLFMTNLTEP